MKKLQSYIKTNWILLVLLVIAVCTRMIGLGRFPNGTYTDEAYSAFLSWGLFSEGIDDYGYRFPVYFVAWGSGMNAMYAYIAALFYHIFGISTAVYRLPQAVFGILGIFSLYVICTELFDRKLALLAAFVLTINPWHIMMCRFGLESNLAPNMFLIGFMFLILGLKHNNKYLIPSAIALGFTLYCYAITWIMIPLFFVFCLLFCWKYIPRNRYSVIFGVILFLLAVPLLLFLGINMDLLPEIRTNFFSIPKLTGFRGSELSLAHIKSGIKDLIMIILTQNEGNNIFQIETGVYYLFTTPFIIFGAVYHFVKIVKNYRHGENDLSITMFIWLVVAVIVSVINNNLTIIHLNMLHVPMIFYGAYGIYGLTGLLKSKTFYYACISFWLVSFGFFIYFYTGAESTNFFGQAPYDAVVRAKEIAGEGNDITFFGYSYYKFPNLIWLERPSMSDYAENAVFDGDLYFKELLEYKNYRYLYEGAPEKITADGVYVIHVNKMSLFNNLGFEIEKVNDSYAVAAMSIPSK